MAAGDSGMGDAFAASVSDAIMTAGTFTEPVSLFVKLCTTAPTGGTAGTGVTTGGYAHQQPGFTFTRAGQTTDNDAVVDFGTLTAGVTVNGIEVWSAAPSDVEGATRIFWIEITPVVFSSGEIPRIPIGDLNITVA